MTEKYIFTLSTDQVMLNSLIKILIIQVALINYIVSEYLFISCSNIQLINSVYLKS